MALVSAIFPPRSAQTYSPQEVLALTNIGYKLTVFSHHDRESEEEKMGLHKTRRDVKFIYLPSREKVQGFESFQELYELVRDFAADKERISSIICGDNEFSSKYAQEYLGGDEDGMNLVYKTPEFASKNADTLDKKNELLKTHKTISNSQDTVDSKKGNLSYVYLIQGITTGYIMQREGLEVAHAQNAAKPAVISEVASVVSGGGVIWI